MGNRRFDPVCKFRGDDEPPIGKVRPGDYWMKTGQNPRVIYQRNNSNTQWMPVSMSPTATPRTDALEAAVAALQAADLALKNTDTATAQALAALQQANTARMGETAALSNKDAELLSQIAALSVSLTNAIAARWRTSGPAPVPTAAGGVVTAASMATSSNDRSGRVSFQLAGLIQGGKLVTVTFAASKGTTAYDVLLTSQAADQISLGGLYVANATATKFEIWGSLGVALLTKTYSVAYLIIDRVPVS